MQKDPEQVAFARELRRRQTQAESLFWAKLRRKPFQGCRFRRQHAIGSYIVDFVCVGRGVVVEVDGGQHSEDVKVRDEKRDMLLQTKGYRVLRFWNNEILTNMEGVLEAIRLCVEQASPSPTPLPQRERGYRPVIQPISESEREYAENPFGSGAGASPL